MIKQLLQLLYNKIFVAGTLKRAYGVDVSHYQPGFNPDLATPGLLDFGIAKATEGVSWKDYLFDIQYEQISKLSVTGAYHYLRSNYSGISQAEFFVSSLGGRKLDLLAIDFEGINNTLNDAFVRILYDSLVRTTELKPECKIILYTNPDIYNRIIYPASIRIWGMDVFTDWDLWIAQYPYVVNLDGQPKMPLKRNDWKIWQFSGSGDAKSHGTLGSVDTDIFNGSKQELLEWVNKIDTQPPQGETMKNTATALGDSTRLRQEHNVNKAFIGSYPAGTRFSGNNLFIADVASLNQYVGDTWLEVLEINNIPSVGWVAIKHLGKLVCSLDVNPPSVGTDKTVVTIIKDGVTATYTTVGTTTIS